MTELAVTSLGGPTVLLEDAGLRILADPTFDDLRRYPDPDGGQALVKTRGPALGTEDWEHFPRTRARREDAFAAAGLTEALVDTPRGERVVLDVGRL